MTIISMKALLESGVHFGHRTHKWHPAMKPYIFTERNSIHIIDLQKTVKALQQAYNIVRDTTTDGGSVLFVGTKRQAQETIQEEALRAGMPYVTVRWLGGMLTNWRTIRARVNELERLERMRDKGDFERITKKEALILSREIERLEMLLGGIRHMARLPELLFVVDVRREETAIHEANLLNIPVIALVDTNCDPRNVDYVIPSNDDAIRAIKLLVAKIADAAIEGKASRKEEPEEEHAAPAQVVMAGAEEPELTDEELLGAATLAKISSRLNVADIAELVTVPDELIDAADLEELATEDLEAEELEEELEAEIEDELWKKSLKAMKSKKKQKTRQRLIMAITTQQIKELREATGTGILDCRKALEQAGGDFDKALDFLREKGLATAAKRADRAASEGMVELYSHGNGRVGVMVEVNCETDFVARSEPFRNFAHEIALQIAASSPHYIKAEEVPAAVLEHEREIARNRAREEGKAEAVLDQIVDGRIEKFLDEVCLLRQV